MDEKDKEELEDELLKIKADIAALRIYVNTFSPLIVSALAKAHGISHENARKVFDKILKENQSLEETQIRIDSGEFDNDIQSLFEGD